MKYFFSKESPAQPSVDFKSNQSEATASTTDISEASFESLNGLVMDRLHQSSLHKTKGALSPCRGNSQKINMKSVTRALGRKRNHRFIPQLSLPEREGSQEALNEGSKLDNLTLLLNSSAGSDISTIWTEDEEDLSFATDEDSLRMDGSSKSNLNNSMNSIDQDDSETSARIGDKQRQFAKKRGESTVRSTQDDDMCSVASTSSRRRVTERSRRFRQTRRIPRRNGEGEHTQSRSSVRPKSSTMNRSSQR